MGVPIACLAPRNQLLVNVYSMVQTNNATLGKDKLKRKGLHFGIEVSEVFAAVKSLRHF
jgi:hypothetical protein